MNSRKYYSITLLLILAIIFIAQISASENYSNHLSDLNEIKVVSGSMTVNEFLVTMFFTSLLFFPLEYKIIVCLAVLAFGFRQVQFYKKVENDLRKKLLKKNPEQPKDSLHNALPPDDIYNKDFTTYAKNLFLIYQDAYERRDFEEMRPFLSPELFEYHSKINEKNIENNHYPRFDDQEIITCSLSNYKISDDGIYEHIHIKLCLSLLEFAHDNKGNIIDGVNTKRNFHEYLLKFKRLHNANLILMGANCPKCGAPSQITFSGNCDYCHSVIISPANGFVLYDVSLWLD